MTEKKLVIQKLEEMAVLMELKGENPFKIRAFSNAARIIQGISQDWDQIISTRTLTEIKGIGTGISNFILQITNTNEPEDLKTLRKEIPTSLLEMLKIPGMGAKKVKAVWQTLHIQSIGELEYACKENRLLDLEGFGEKSQQKILQGIELLKRYSNRHLLSEVVSEAEQIQALLREFPEVETVEISGDLRRWCEVIEYIQIIVCAADNNHETIILKLTAELDPEEVSQQGDAETMIRLKNGIKVILIFANKQVFPFVLHHTTGSADYIDALTSHAMSMKLKIDKFGISENEGAQIPCQSETDIFKNLNIPVIAPEIRENSAVIEAARNHNLPLLLGNRDIQGVIHTHTTYSDGLHSLEQLAEAVRSSGYRYLVISDHSKSAIYANGLTEVRLNQQMQEIDRLNKNWENFRVLKSIECDILSDGQLDYSNEILSQLDLVIASIHSRFKMTEAEATTRIIRAMENPYTTIIGHPTGRLLLAREGYPLNIKAIIDAAAALQIAIELNANPHRLDLDWRWLKEAQDKGVMISINPDAHRIEGIADMQFGIAMARKGWLSPENVLNCLNVEEICRFAKSRQTGP